MVSICALVSIYSYKFTVSNGGGGSFGFDIYMVSIYSYTLTVLNGGGGSFGFDIYMVSIYSYTLTVLNGGGGSFDFGIYMCIGLYIFLSVYHFKWGLIYDIDQQRVHSFHWQFQVGGRRVHLPLVSICAVSSIYIDLPLHEIHQ